MSNQTIKFVSQIALGALTATAVLKMVDLAQRARKAAKLAEMVQQETDAAIQRASMNAAAANPIASTTPPEANFIVEGLNIIGADPKDIDAALMAGSQARRDAAQ